MFGMSEEVDVHIGTLSKAAGAHGGFVACSAALKSLLLNKGRPYMFSTALAVPVVAAALAAVRVNEQVQRSTSLSHLGCCYACSYAAPLCAPL